jgi:putative ATP-dependent endonuclease of OLD family
VRIARLNIKNFRGIREGELLIPSHAVLVGDNNIGKSSLLEAVDLVLGPERLARRPVIDEHDFYAGQYMSADGVPRSINVEVVVADLTDEQAQHFRNHIEWWDDKKQELLEGPPPEGTDAPNVKPALRVAFSGSYDIDEDDFVGSTFFCSPLKEDGTFDTFKTSDKRLCGFLYLRTLRTGSRALSLEKGSLLDIILRLQEEKNFKIWEEVLDQLRVLPVAEQPELGMSEILASVQNAIKGFMPVDSVTTPHLRVSDLTRDTLRRTLTVFMATGSKTENGLEYSAPFQHQGTGTINTLVLALLSLIADLRQNVIFAMEEPEIAIPPHTQKRIIHGVRSKSAQALFTSHSPYVLEEFPPEQILVLTRTDGVLSAVAASYPPSIKPKQYKAEVRQRSCEALLSRRVLITEGRTEYDAYPAAARRLHELHPEEFSSLEALGIAVIDAQTDSQVALLGQYYKSLGKIVFAVFDKQAAAQKAAIELAVKYPFEAAEKGFENILLNGAPEAAVRRFATGLVAAGEWPTHLLHLTPTALTPYADLKTNMGTFFKWAKGHGTAADFLTTCTRDEMPKFIVDTLLAIQSIVVPKITPPALAESEPGQDPAVGTIPVADAAEAAA